MGARMRVTTVLLLSTLVAAPALAAGFDFPTQSAKALAMGGTFVAQANDPTTIYYNPGGLGLLAKKKGASLGLTGPRPWADWVPWSAPCSGPAGLSMLPTSSSGARARDSFAPPRPPPSWSRAACA